MVITIFRSRLRAKYADEYVAWAERIHGLAETMPGFVAIKTFTAPDGERVSLVEFATEAAHEAWRSHPEHREAQRLGRERFYAEYRIQVCELRRELTFSAASAENSSDSAAGTR
jgi:heme-degrading monooxygenase HmoA